MSEGARFAIILGQQLERDLFAPATSRQFDCPRGGRGGARAYVDLMGDDKVVKPNDATFQRRAPEASEEFAKGKTGMLISQNNTENNLKSAAAWPRAPTASRQVPVARQVGHKPIMTHVAGIDVFVSRTPSTRTRRWPS